MVTSCKIDLLPNDTVRFYLPLGSKKVLMNVIVKMSGKVLFSYIALPNEDADGVLFMDVKDEALWNNWYFTRPSSISVEFEEAYPARGTQRVLIPPDMGYKEGELINIDYDGKLSQGVVTKSDDGRLFVELGRPGGSVRSATCPECYGTGYRYGFGGPCTKGCRV